MFENHRDYYERRAAECREMAENATNPSVKQLYTEFADRYVSLVEAHDERQRA